MKHIDGWQRPFFSEDDPFRERTEWGLYHMEREVAENGLCPTWDIHEEDDGGEMWMTSYGRLSARTEERPKNSTS